MILDQKLQEVKTSFRQDKEFTNTATRKRNDRFRDSEESNRLVASLGGDFIRRKTLLASLNQHEFLVVLDEKEEVRNLLEHPSVGQVLSTLQARD